MQADSEMLQHVFGLHTHLIAALFATQLVFELYGAGFRRPFGSLVTVRSLPNWLHDASWSVKIADVAFVIYLLLMWTLLFGQMTWWVFLLLAWLFALVGDFLAHRIPLVPSFFITITLAICSIYLVWPIARHYFG